MSIADPPFQRVFDILHRFAQVSVKLACLRWDGFGY